MEHPGQSMRLSLILTSRCNLSCRYCYQSAHRPGSMSWPTLRAAVDFALGTRRPAVDLTFYGGEPLLEFPLLKRALEYAEANRRNDTRLRCWATTNGTLMTDEVSDFLDEHNVKVRLSFDGIEQAQDVRAAGSFAYLDRLLDSLREEHPRFFRNHVQVSVTVPPTSVTFLADSVDYLVSKGVREIHLTPVLTPYPGWTNDSVGELDQQFERILERSLAHLAATGEVPLALFSRPDTSPGSDPTTRAMCEIANGSSWAVDVDGRVYGCTLFARSYQDFQSPMLRACMPTLHLGDIRDQRLPERLRGFPREVARIPMFTRKEKKYSAYRSCADCEYFGSCVICPASIGHIPDNQDPHRVPDYYCAFVYASRKSRECFPTQPTPLERVRGAKYDEERLRWRAIAKAAGTSG